MSFSIYAVGKKQDVLTSLATQTAYGDPSVHFAVRDALAKIVDGAPEDGFVVVTANGHHDYSGVAMPLCSVAVDLKVYPQKYPK